VAKQTLCLKPMYLQMVKAVIDTTCPHATVVAYGSRVGGNERTVHSGTDLDLAVMDFGPSGTDITDLREAFRESNLPFLVDVFDYHLLPDDFQSEISRNAYPL